MYCAKCDQVYEDTKKPTHASLMDPNSNRMVADLLDEGLGILNALIDNIKRKGNYSAESTCVFIDQAGAAFREARLRTLSAQKHEPSTSPTENETAA